MGQVIIGMTGRSAWLRKFLDPRTRANALHAVKTMGLAPAPDEQSKAYHLAQTRQMIRLSRVGTIASILMAGIMSTALIGPIAPLPIALWLVASVAFFGVRFRWCGRLLADPEAMARAAARPMTLIILAGCAALPFIVPGILWFDQLDSTGKLTICILMTAVMSGGCLSLSTIPAAAFAYLAELGVGLVMNFASMGLYSLVTMTAIFWVSLAMISLTLSRRFAATFTMEIELAEKSQLVELLRAFDASGSSWVWEMDARSRIRMMSAPMARSLGIAPRKIVGRRARHAIDPQGRGFAMSSGVRAIAEHVRRGREFRDLALPILDGRHWWSLSGKPIHDETGRLTGWRGVGSDITDSRLTGSDSTATARRDPLTKLANRLLIRELVEEALIRNAAGGPTCILLLIDLDRFKQVNDTLGHAVGDQLLCQVAERLTKAAAGVGQVGRLGGDEFAVLMQSGASTRNLGGFCRDLIQQLSNGYRIGDANLVIGASIGVACGPIDGSDDQALIRSADLALYRAKESGRGQHAFYMPEMLAEAQENRLLESDVRTALANGQLSLVYQPIVDAVTREIVGREALLRWDHPERGAIAPDRFVPIIEDLGLIGQIGSWVIHQACADAICWPEPERVAVNISVAQLSGASLSIAVVAALGATGLAPDRLELEVTESIFLGDDPATIRSLSSLRALGVRLVLDDFGKGYSSFGYLSRATFAKIKIDRLFVRAAAAGCRQSRAIVGSILALARGLDLETTAEGIETADEARLMSVIGCSQLQGFYFGHPEPFDHAPVPRPTIAGGRGGHDRRIVRFG